MSPPNTQLYEAFLRAYHEHSFLIREKMFSPERLAQVQNELPDTDWLAPVKYLELAAHVNALVDIATALVPQEQHQALIEKLKPFTASSDP